MRTTTARLHIVLASLLPLLSGCIYITTTDISGTPVTTIGRASLLKVNLTLVTDATDIAGVETRLEFDPTRFDFARCYQRVSSHNFFTASAPQVSGALRTVRVLSFGTTMSAVTNGTQVTQCDLVVKSDAPLGPTTLRTYASTGAAPPVSVGQAGQTRALPDYSTTITIQ